MSLALYKEYDKVIEKLAAAIRNGKLAHAYIFEGDSFSQKEEIAKEFAKAILCEENPGIGCDRCKTCKMVDANTYRDIYYFGSDENSIKDKDIVELQSRMANRPIEQGRRNIAIVADADLMTTRAQNRLLKLLEEPYAGSCVILLSENSDRLLETVRSRCQRFRFYALGDEPGSNADSEYTEMARRVIKRLGKNDYFFETKNETASIKDKKSALAFLDAMERELRDVMVGNSEIKFPRERAEQGIKLVEEARKNINYNIIAKNVLGALVLKMGG